MKISRRVITAMALLGVAWPALSQDVTVRKRSGVSFTGLHTYSLRGSLPIKPAVDVAFLDDVRKAMAAKGWHELPSGGEIEVDMSYTWQPIIPNTTELPDTLARSANAPFSVSAPPLAIDPHRDTVVTVRAFIGKAKAPAWFGCTTYIDIEDPNIRLDRLDEGVSKTLAAFPAAT